MVARMLSGGNAQALAQAPAPSGPNRIGQSGILESKLLLRVVNLNLAAPDQRRNVMPVYRAGTRRKTIAMVAPNHFPGSAVDRIPGKCPSKRVYGFPRPAA